MNLIRDVICFTFCMICLIFYAVGALSLVPFIVFFIILFRIVEMICALLATPFLFIIEKTSNKTFKRRTVKRIFEYTLNSMCNDWRFIRYDLLDL